MIFKSVKRATFDRNVKAGKWVPLEPIKPDAIQVLVRIPKKSRGVHNVAGRTMICEFRLEVEGFTASPFMAEVWERAMGMVGYAGSPAEKEDRKP